MSGVDSFGKVSDSGYCSETCVLRGLGVFLWPVWILCRCERGLTDYREPRQRHASEGWGKGIEVEHCIIRLCSMGASYSS